MPARQLRLFIGEGLAPRVSWCPGTGQPGRAAELTGLHPQTLRLYEQEGLLSPACWVTGAVMAIRRRERLAPLM